MSFTFDIKPSQRTAALTEWLPVIAGLLALYVPTFYDLAASLWQQDDHAHGPIILAIIVWLIWQKRQALYVIPAQAGIQSIQTATASAPNKNYSSAPVSGFAVLVFGLLLYVVGRSQNITLFEVGALLPILAGVVLATRGWPALRALWFALLFIAFLVPFPNIYVDALTGPLKQNVSAIAEQLLYTAGYPIARDGVMLTIGQYQLLVADACSGLNSMFSLAALGLLYLYVVRHQSWLHNGLILASILPIAFAANVIRVVALVLVTYHFGDEAGQGFLHGAAGMVLVMAALIIILALDAILARVIKPRLMSNR